MADDETSRLKYQTASQTGGGDEEGGFDATGRAHIYSSEPWYSRHKRGLLIGVLLAVIIAIAVAIAVAQRRSGGDGGGGGVGPSNNANVNALVSRVSTLRMTEHLTQLMAIAGLPGNSGSRAVQFGYAQSGQYVVQWLQANTNLVVTQQEFLIPISIESVVPNLTVLTPDSALWGVQSLVPNSDYISIMYSGPGVVINHRVRPIIGGCDASDFAELGQGEVVLLDKRADILPDCGYINKLRNSFLAGAGAALVYDSWGVSGTPTALPIPAPTAGRLAMEGGGGETTHPVFGLTPRLATLFMKMAAAGALNVSLASQRHTVNYTTFNILAETAGGNADQVVMFGSHLDSVPAGPGINDNGSGSSANLELATVFSQAFPGGTANKVRFAWWTAEELGLIGSYHYLSVMPPADKARIACNINMDMLGSPNFYMGIHDGGQANVPSTVNGSLALTDLFVQWFISQKINYKLISMGGGSDYYPFIQHGIPAGGLATGAGGLKGFDDRALFGGEVNAANDPCYHQYCDSMGPTQGSNVDFTVLNQNTQAAAAVLAQLATADLKAMLGPRTQFDVDAALSPHRSVTNWFPGGVSNRDNFQHIV